MLSLFGIIKYSKLGYRPKALIPIVPVGHSNNRISHKWMEIILTFIGFT
jgi:hypothetical protein